MNYTAFDLAFSWPLILLIVLGAVVVAFSFWSYRETLPPVAAWKHMTLSLLRSFSLLLVLFLLFEPMLSLGYQETLKPIVAILVDTSESMSVRDAATDRPAILRKLLSNPQWKILAERADVEWYSIADRLRPLVPSDTMTLTGHATDITASLETLKNDMIGRPLQATVVISDGRVNVGANPVSYAPLFGGPVFAVGVGESKEQKDVFIGQVIANETAYKESTVPADASISAFGYAGRRLSVRLLHNGREIQNRFVDAPEDGGQVRVPFDFKADEEGLQKYEIRIDRLDGELTDKNNEKAFFVRVLKNKTRVHLVSGAPGYDHSFLYQAMMDDPNVDVVAWVGKKNGGFMTGPEEAPFKDGEADGYVLNHFPTANTSMSVFQRLASAILEGNKGVMVLYGPETDLKKLESLQPVSAVVWRPDKVLEEVAVPVALTLAGRYSALLKLSENPSETAGGWAEWPPVLISRVVAEPLPGSDVLAKADVSKLGRVLQSRGDLPLIVTRRTAKSKSLIVAAYGLGRTHLMAKGLGRSQDAYRTLVANGVRWISTMEDSKPVLITTSKRVYRRGERLLFSAQVYDDALRPANDAIVSLEVSGNETSVPLQLNALGNGRYESTLEGLPVGDYRFEGEGRRGDFSMGSDKGRFAVEAYSIELINTSLNEPLLKGLAAQSGGVYVGADSVDGLFGHFRLENQIIEHHIEIEIWNKMILLFLLAAALSAEWWIRKRNDML